MIERRRAIKVATIARRLDVDESTVLRWVRDGALRAVDVRARKRRATYRVLVVSLEGFLRSRGLTADEIKQVVSA